MFIQKADGLEVHYDRDLVNADDAEKYIRNALGIEASKKNFKILESKKISFEYTSDMKPGSNFECTKSASVGAYCSMEGRNYFLTTSHGWLQENDSVRTPSGSMQGTVKVTCGPPDHPDTDIALVLVESPEHSTAFPNVNKDKAGQNYQLKLLDFLVTVPKIFEIICHRFKENFDEESGVIDFILHEYKWDKGELKYPIRDRLCIKNVRDPSTLFAHKGDSGQVVVFIAEDQPGILNAIGMVIGQISYTSFDVHTERDVEANLSVACKFSEGFQAIRNKICGSGSLEIN